ncbi:hypothetical protein DFP74_5077 [Nocardiopsis sp. Huas11]|uniref:hypothetical protein n=1 Tax=Nocardiopsis sp. Huas11 TaxID=2183912 RepID=UPI000EAC97C6|nr:hypothetical protein [Nocardiopsis sp. Huas11]RKS09342.1 hypothetical protein DFP74_5077 [Nocardiopsis sp. Huas11]
MIEDLVARVESGDESVIDALVDHAAADPAAMAPYLPRLLDAGVFWRLHVLYRGADDDFQRQVVAEIDSGTDEGTAVLAHVLAQTRGPVVEEAFRRWAQSPPLGPHFDPYRRGVAALTRDGGWELAPNGIRELCGTGAYRFVPGPDGERADEACPRCASPLWAVLDLDTADPKAADALAHTGWRGRLRVLTCHLCSCYGTVYTEVAAEGKAGWSAHTVRPPILPVDRPEEPPLVAFVPGARRPTPFMASAWDRGGSTLGGCPDWIDDPSYPVCPGCGRAMDYLALVGGADLYDAEGAYYVFLHAPCGLAAVEYQQS